MIFDPIEPSPDAPCLKYSHEVESRPHPTYSSGRAWDCPRCGKVFSEPHPTYMPGTSEVCDNAPNASPPAT